MINLFLAVVGLLLLAGLGFPLGLALLAVGFVGLGFVHPKGFDIAGVVLGQQVIDLSTNYQFAVLPLFILMGVFVTRSGIADDLYHVTNRWFGHFRGGLAMSTIAACGGMAAISGSSLATAATMTRVAIPTMRKYKYHDSFSAGTVAAGGTLGILIPPSTAMIIYGLLAEVDIGKMFIAGIIPGLITILAYIGAIKLVCTVRPNWAPVGPRSGWGERFRSLTQVWSILALFGFVMGGIFMGIFTASEGGGFGAIGALIIGILRRKMTFRIFLDSLLEAGRTTATVFTVGVGALTLNQFVNLSGAPEEILTFVTSVSPNPWVVVGMILFCYVILGMVIDGPAMIFLTVPIFVPLVALLDLGMTPELQMIWWGVIVVVVVEVSMITPPVGMNIFVIKSMMPDLGLNTVYKGVLPFFLADLFRLILFLAAPSTVLWLVRVMG